VALLGEDGSTIVEINGEHEALATIIQKIQFSQQVAHQLALQTGMRRVVWDTGGMRYELLINDLPDLGRAQVNTDMPVLRQKKIRRVVVIMHGIRDEGEWMPPLERLIRDETGAEAQSLNIDRISLTRFLLAELFLGYVKSYSDAALQLLSNYDEADVLFIAHSYGTWCLRDLLNNWPYKGSIMPTGIIVCGSILPMNCPWGKIHSSIFKRPRQDAELRAFSTPPKPGRFAVILLFTLIPLLIFGTAWLAATVFNKTKPDTITPTPTPLVTPAPGLPNDLVEHLNTVWRTLWGENAENMLRESEDLEPIKRRTEEIITIMYGKDVAEKLPDTSLREQITKKILPDLFGSE
jgi:hypothetical protein